MELWAPAACQCHASCRAGSPAVCPPAYLPARLQELLQDGFTEEQIAAQRAAVAAQLQQLKAAAEEGKSR